MEDIKRPLKEVRWIGSSYDDFMEFPQSVLKTMGFALHQVQGGVIPRNSKKLKGAQVGAVELIDDYDGDTFRTVYTVKIGDVVYILHAFKKKSKTGIKTPPKDLDLIRRRLRLAEEDYRNEE